MREKEVRYRKKYPEKVAAKERRRSLQRPLQKRGLTQEQYDAILEAQGHCCAICKRSIEEVGRATLFIDHCHATGLTRGLLCPNCNTGLGMYQDDPERLRTAIEYLERYKR